MFFTSYTFVLKVVGEASQKQSGFLLFIIVY